MASISKKPNSPYFMAKFRDAEGRIVMRSTKQTSSKAARSVADAWEDAATKARRGELTRATALKVLGEMVEKSTGEILHDISVEDFLNGWIRSIEVTGRSEGTLTKYRPIVRDFIVSMSIRSKKTIRGVTATDVRLFYEKLLSLGKSSATANLEIRILKAAFERAKKEGYILANPAAQVDLAESDSARRHPFTDDQIRQLLTAANPEWTGMVLFGVHTGIRLSDAANLIWSNIDLANRTLKFIPRKTKRSAKAKDKELTIALHQDIVQWLNTRQGLSPVQHLFPSLHSRPTGSHTGLSNEFSKLMTKTGINKLKGTEKQGRGRQSTLLSFHSLRHSCVSRLANADVAADVRKNITGHSTDASHTRYTHLAVETQRRAIEQMAGFLEQRSTSGT